MSDYVLGSSKSSSFPWLTLYPITQFFGTNGETGVDIGTPFHTPITSMFEGQVLGAGYYGGGGVVSVSTSLNGAPAAWYVQHLDEIDSAIHVGETVHVGQVLGLSGGQLSGGSHPSTRQFSSGPHTETGFNPPYGGMWNPNNWGPNVNPIPALTAALSAPGAPSPVSLPNLGAAVAGTTIRVTTAPGLGPLAQSLHNEMAHVPVSGTSGIGGAISHNVNAYVTRGIVVGAGLLLIGVVLVRVVVDETAHTVNTAAQVLPIAVTAGLL